MVLPEGVLMEILLRLPLKYLCVCKCVSKTWWSIISEIKKLHHARNLGIFISNFGCSSSSSLFQARLGLDNNNIPLFKKLVGGSESAEIGFTQVINGLFGFYTQGVGGVLTLCNCYICETRNIPLPRFSRWTHKIQFYLGFDLSGGNYKLLSLGSPRNHDLVMYQEILTLGGMNNHNITIGSWIKMLPTDSLLPEIDVLCKPSLCINGILYWLVECKDNKRKILAFNLLRGCFYDIFLPAEIAAAAAKMVSFKGSSTVESLAVGCLVAGEDSVTSSSKLNIWELISGAAGSNIPLTCPKKSSGAIEKCGAVLVTFQQVRYCWLILKLMMMLISSLFIRMITPLKSFRGLSLESLHLVWLESLMFRYLVLN
ncbi:hypothetical protein FXO37_35102 [Capsicum annuum]|nr:hypothetical protein FXO37_35102 [Capsicum annuum]